MTFSYDPSSLSEALNRLRFLVQDTTDTGHFFEDAEIGFAAGQEENIYRAAANLCRTIAARLSKTPSLEDATVKFEADSRAKTYLKLADDYEAKAKEIDAGAGGTGSDSVTMPSLPSRPPAFTRGLHID